MPRGGARPGAGRPPKHAAEEKRDRAARQLSKCKEEIQANLLDLTKAAIAEAMAGDKALLKFLLEQGIGKAPVMPTSTPDTEIKVVLGNIPRPGRGNAGNAEKAPEMEATYGNAASEEELAAPDDGSVFGSGILRAEPYAVAGEESESNQS